MDARIAASAELDAVPRALVGIEASVGSVAGPAYPDRPARPGAPRPGMLAIGRTIQDAPALRLVPEDGD